jgi:hypothetical protein
LSANANLTVDVNRIHINGSGLTPGSFAGAELTYTSYNGQRKFSTDLGVLDGLIGTSYEVDDDGSVRIAMGRTGLVGGVVPGRLTGALATTAGELVRLLAEVA